MKRVVVLPPPGPATADGLHPGGWWHEVEPGTGLVACDLCPRACHIRPGQRGFCFVRENRDGAIYSTTYGRSTGFCIDPIEKKPLYHFLPGTPVLSFGTPGCNLGCRFCQNWTMSRAHDVAAACESAAPEAIAAAARQLGCRSVAFTYNDPVIWAEYAIDTARACRAAGIKTVAVTSGYIAAGARAAFFEAMDAANVDLKAFREDFYVQMTGGHLQPVLDTLRWLVHESNTWLEITTLLIPAANDSPAELRQMCDWIAAELGPEVPLHFTAFHPDFKLADREPTPPETLLMAHEIARQAGLRYVFTGNVYDPEHQHTFCPGCGRLLIERQGYELGAFHLRQGRCEFCGSAIAGHFEEHAGVWGSKRRPVRIRPLEQRDAAATAPPTLPALAASQLDPPKAPLEPATLDQATAEEATADKTIAESSTPKDAAIAEKPVAAAQVGEPTDSDAPASDPTADTARAKAAPPDETSHEPAAPPVEEPAEDLCVPCPAPLAPTAASPPTAYRASLPQPELTDADRRVLLAAAARRVAAAVFGQACEPVAAMLGPRLASLPLYGVFVTLKRHRKLRSCCGFLGQPIELGEALRHAALRAATDDPRFPPIAPDELDELSFDVWLLWGLRPVAARGAVRAAEIEIGRHGVQIKCGQARGLLLPSVAVEHGLDAVGLLRQVAAKAGLPPDAWLDDDAQLMTFEGTEIHGEVAAALALPLASDERENAPRPMPGPSRSSAAPSPYRHAEPANPAESPIRSGPPRELKADEAMAAAAHAPADAAASTTAAPAAPRAEAWITPELTAAAAALPPVREAAVAGMFYPRSAAAVRKTVAELFADAPQQPEPWAAALAPHAGWIYSGRLAARVFARVQAPARVIVFCPRHRPIGARWAVEPHRRWRLPGFEVPAAAELAIYLAERVEGFELDAAPHRQEHAIEVQLPLLHEIAPAVEVVGVAMGGGDLPMIERMAEQLAAALDRLPEQPLLLISSDMNHFADEARTRAIDRVAIEAMQTLDAAALFEAVEQRRISMCGVLPATLVMATLRRQGRLTRSALVGYTTSAEASGDTHRVVGYAGMLFG